MRKTNIRFNIQTAIRVIFERIRQTRKHAMKIFTLVVR